MSDNIEIEVNKTIKKGSRVRARWLNTRQVSLAGMQMKLEGRFEEIVGTVLHIRGDKPENPTQVELVVQSDTGQVCNAIKLEWVVEVL